MQPLRHRINPKAFVITLRQIAKHLKINQERIVTYQTLPYGRALASDAFFKTVRTSFKVL
jgi:hypothetical protein